MPDPAATGTPQNRSFVPAAVGRWDAWTAEGKSLRQSPLARRAAGGRGCGRRVKRAQSRKLPRAAALIYGSDG
jgi:hypothetical protein